MHQINITLENLTARQYVLADIIWACGLQSEVDRFCDSLPTVELRNEARAIERMILLAAAEQRLNNDDIIAQQTRNIIRQFQLGK